MMSRPARIEFPGAVNRAMARGDRYQGIEVSLLADEEGHDR